MVRFDKPCRQVRGAVGYFREHMMIGDYLTEGGAAHMTWLGQGATMLGLAGTCRREDFEQLCRGLDPRTAEKLMVRNKGAQRRVCFFGQISPPKDVSIAALVGGDSRIRGWWDEAVGETLREIEATVSTRVRRARETSDRRTGCMVGAMVTHDTNRALDPQLHTHVCIMNLTYDSAEERWKGLQPSGLYRHQGYFREVCYNRLAARLREAGYRVEKTSGMGFRLAGMPPDLRTVFSKRRQEILRQAALTGAQSQDALQALASSSRAAKTKATAVTLRTHWIEECGAAFPFLQRLIGETYRNEPSLPQMSATQAMTSGGAHLFERNSVVDERVLLREAMAFSSGDVSLADLKSSLQVQIQTGVLLRDGEQVTSREALASENEFVAWAKSRRNAELPLGDLAGRSDLSVAQFQALGEIIRSPSTVTVFQGDAGTGKTTCLKAIIAARQRMGGGVMCCAPSAAATDVLRQELGVEAMTLQRFLISRKLQQESRGRLLIVDEAGLISVGEMRDLCRRAAEHKLRLLLVGDTKQHTAVEAGDALRCLMRFSGVPAVRLTEIHRQKSPAYRRAVSLLAERNVTAAMDQLTRLGAVREIRDFPALLRRAAADYVAALRAGQSCLVIAPVWNEIHAFNAEARSHLKAEGMLDRQERPMITICSMKWTREQRRRIGNYQPGDRLSFYKPCFGFAKGESTEVVGRANGGIVVRMREGGEIHLPVGSLEGFDVGISRTLGVAVGDRLLIRANHAEAGLRNGEIVTVAGWATGGGIALTDGRAVPSDFFHFGYGYATTSHGAQGKTVDRGILLLGEEGMAAANLKQAYVANSRFRENQVIYTTDRLAAREAMQRPADRLLAKEMSPVLSSPEIPNKAKPAELSKATGPKPASRSPIGVFRPGNG